MELAPCARLGVYEILSPLGAGGMGEVYRARDTRLGREVAIKVLPAAFAGDVERMTRFQREARLLALLNHPGIATLYGFEEADWDRVLAVDLKSVFLATRAAAPAMMARGGGSVICVSSIAGHRGHGRTAYSAAKAGIEGFVRTVAVQLGPRGIRVNAIAPGTVWTPMVESLGPDARERRRQASPLGTEGTGWDIGWGAVYLASDESRWVTGQTLVVDGGQLTF